MVFLREQSSVGEGVSFSTVHVMDGRTYRHYSLHMVVANTRLTLSTAS
jgi:hypothetical protein